MLTFTSELALKALIHMALSRREEPFSPRELAEQIGASPTYMAKVIRLLVKADILRARRGVAGGAILARMPEDISVLSVVEACQGRILGNYCRETDDLRMVCSYHEAMVDIHKAITQTLAKWTLAGLLEKPEPSPKLPDRNRCRMVHTPKAVKSKR